MGYFVLLCLQDMGTVTVRTCQLKLRTYTLWDRYHVEVHIPSSYQETTKQSGHLFVLLCLQDMGTVTVRTCQLK